MSRAEEKRPHTAWGRNEAVRASVSHFLEKRKNNVQTGGRTVIQQEFQQGVIQRLEQTLRQRTNWERNGPQERQQNLVWQIDDARPEGCKEAVKVSEESYQGATELQDALTYVLKYG